MGLFAAGRSTARRGSTAGPEVWAELPDEVRVVVPAYFEAVGEAQTSGSGSVEACREAGVRSAEEGVPLGDALDRLMRTSRMVARREATYAEIHAVATAWGEATLGYLHRLSCQDPMTGLATQAHLRSRLSDLYRAASRVGTDVRRTHALVVVETLEPVTHPLATSMRLARLGEVARTAFAGPEAIGAVGRSRVVVVGERDDRLTPRVGVLRTMLDRCPSRIWVEGLPGTDTAAGALLDELAR